MLPNLCLLPEVQESFVQSCHLWSNWTVFHPKPPGFTQYPCLTISFSSLSPWILPSCLPFAILSLLSCIQFLISRSLSLCVPLLCPSLWLLFLSPALYLTLICWYGSGCIIQEDTCSLFITEQKKGGEEWANEGGWNWGREIHKA